MKKHKVLIVHNYYQIPGGEDTVVENEKNLLLDNGHEVIMYTRHNDEIKKKSLFGKLLLPIETIFSMKTYKDVKKIIKKEKIDIVHVHNTLPLISPSVYYAARHCDVPVVQTVHNFRLLCPGATFTRNNKICKECVEKNLLCAVKNKCYRNSTIQSFVTTFNLWIHRLIGTYNKVDGYIALTEFNKEKLSKLININKIYVKPNFMINKLSKNKNEEKKYFIYIGRVDELKGIKILLNAWKTINNSKLFIVGSGPYENNAKKFVKENFIDNIEFLGFRKKNEILTLLKGAKALIVPSQWYEGFPMTIVEAFSQGIPVIASDIGNLSTIIKNEINGLLFKYNESNELTKAIDIVNNNDSLLKKMENGAIQSFKENYNEKKNYNILINIYESVLGRNYE